MGLGDLASHSTPENLKSKPEFLRSESGRAYFSAKPAQMGLDLISGKDGNPYWYPAEKDIPQIEINIRTQGRVFLCVAFTHMTIMLLM